MPVTNFEERAIMKLKFQVMTPKSPILKMMTSKLHQNSHSTYLLILVAINFVQRDFTALLLRLDQYLKWFKN